MRVIAGEFRGLRLNEPKNRNIRPTTDRIKEDIFNIIAPYLAECRFLDLFSGSGAIGIEAVSRGCLNATLVESERDGIALIRSNIEKTKASERFVVRNQDVVRFLQMSADKYDVIFMDPPYKLEIIEKVFEILSKRDIITDNGVIVLEQGTGNELAGHIGNFEIFKSKKYSSTIVYFLRQSIEADKEN